LVEGAKTLELRLESMLLEYYSEAVGVAGDAIGTVDTAIDRFRQSVLRPVQFEIRWLIRFVGPAVGRWSNGRSLGRSNSI